jgi:hypothetical protein
MLKVETLEVAILPSRVTPSIIGGTLLQEPIVVNWPERKGLCAHNNRKEENQAAGHIVDSPNMLIKHKNGVRSVPQQ